MQFTLKEADCDFLSALLITCQAEFLLSLLRTDAPRVTLARVVQQHLPASKVPQVGAGSCQPGLRVKHLGGTWAALGVLCSLEFLDPPLSLSNEQTPSTRVWDEARSPAEDGSLPQQGKVQGQIGVTGNPGRPGLSPPSRPRVPVAVRAPPWVRVPGAQSLPGSRRCHRTGGTEREKGEQTESSLALRGGGDSG